MRRAAIALVSVVWGVLGCCGDDPKAPEAAPTTPEPTNVAVTEPGDDIALDLFEEVASCEVYHRGALLDVGSASTDGRYGFSIQPPGDVQNVTREGATWARIDSGRVSVRYVQPETGPVFVETRIRGLGSRAATVRIDGRVLGTLRFARDEVSVVRTSATEEPIEAGERQLSLAFHRSRRSAPTAEIDWIRIGTPDDDPSTYAAPTLRDLAVEVSIGARPHRALALRAPGAVRCPLAVREGMKLRGLIGYAGPGEGEARINIIEAGAPPMLLQAAKIGGEEQNPAEVDIALEGLAGRTVVLELESTRTGQGGRMLFGDHVVTVHRPAPPARSRARVVVLVVLSSLDMGQIPPYAEVPALASLTDLAAASATFRQHRTTTSVTAGSMASLLTALPPAAHRVLDGGARLPARVSTLATLARDGRVATGMFTGNPTTFAAFGFNQGWDTFAAFSPVSGTSARAPLQQAAVWLEKRLKEDDDGQVLLVVHARGGHPPWAASTDELKTLPPAEYNGPILARRGAQVLAKERNRRYGRPRLTAADRIRIDGLAALALAAEDQFLGQLIELLRRERVWDSTMLVVTGDVGMGESGQLPYSDGESLSEELLSLPLIVHFPGGRFAGKVIDAPTSCMDLSRTAIAALQLRPPDALRGRDLFEVAAEPSRFELPVQVATLGASYSTRWGSLFLRGTSGRAPVLCSLSLDPDCAADRSGEMPFIASYLWRLTYAHYREAAAAMLAMPAREPATIDPETVAALTVWGLMQAQ